MKHSEHILHVIAVLLAIMWPCDGMGQAKTRDGDTTALLTPGRHTEAIVNAPGDTTYIYSYDPIPLDAREVTVLPGGDEDNDDIAVQRPPAITLPTTEFSSIPFSEGVSPTGARTYDIPVMTASGCRLTPSVSLAYNSQTGNGVAGYGWNVAGGSAITVVGKSIHYDGGVSAVDLSDPATCAFTLDGTRLVTNGGQPSDYQYETAQGFILVKAHYAGEAVAYFTVAYPNGNTATFGFTDNKRMQPSYPITVLRDRHGNRMDFSYTESGGCLYLSRISYGGRSADKHPAEIAFEYTDRTDFTTIYIGGVPMRADKLLRGIVSSDVVGGKKTEICRYTLTHSFGNGTNRLAKVECGSGNTYMPPLTFVYGGAYDEKMPVLEKSTGLSMGRYFSKAYNANPIYVRGKFQKNKYTDGLVTWPGCFDSYTVTGYHVLTGISGESVKIPVYGSGYPANQGILIARTIGQYSHVDSILTENGFQSIQAVDIDGDGTDEIVKLNITGKSRDNTTFRVSVYGKDSDITRPQTFSFSIDKALDSGKNTYSPAQCAYYWGDFRGDGRNMLLVMAYTPNEEKSMFFYLVDVAHKQSLGRRLTLTDYNADNDLIMPLDIDGDGMYELCRAQSGGVDIYRLGEKIFERQRTDRSISSAAFGGRAVCGDINGDGKIDILVAPEESYEEYLTCDVPVWAPARCYLCGCQEPITSISARRCRKCNADLLAYCRENNYTLACRKCHSTLKTPTGGGDPACEKDGPFVMQRLDLGLVDKGDKWTVYTSTGTAFAATVANIVKNMRGDRFILMDMNNDGLGDLLRIHGTSAMLHLNECGAIQPTATCHTDIPDGTDLLPSNIWQVGRVSNLITVNDGDVTGYSYARDFSRLNLLTQMVDSRQKCHTNYYRSLTDDHYFYRTETTRNTAYPYALMMRPLHLLSANTVESETQTLENRAYNYCNAVYNNEGPGFLGFEKTTVLDYLADKKTETTHDPRMLGVVTRVATPESVQTTEYACDADKNHRMNPKAVSSADTDLLTGVTVRRTATYDQYNNPTSITTDQGSVRQTVQTTTYRNTATADCYLVGLPTSTGTTVTRGGESWTTRETIAYDAQNMPATRTSLAGGGKVSTTRYTYDSFGNVTGEKSAPYNVTEFKGTVYGYDTEGRHMTVSVNALGQTTKYSDYDKFGNACTVEDYRGRRSTYEYDSMGRLTRQKNPDGTAMSVVYAMGENGGYSVRTSRTGKPAETALYDALDRETRRMVQRFDGKWQCVDKEYDKLGRLSRESMPYLDSDTPTKWTTYEYDVHNRPIRCLEASGRETVWSYDGLSTTERKDHVTTTRTLDATGALVRVEDAGGVVSYTLRPDGQPSRIVAPGNAVTTIGYDQFGRRTSIDDPSFGLQRSAEAYAPDGTRTQVTADAAGKTVETVYDAYGRKKSETRAELKTTYEYDSDGNMTRETSSNGVGTVCSYDGLGRLKTRIRTMRDKSITKGYSYADGQVAIETVVMNAGNSGTTSFSLGYGYEYGHLVNITFNNTVPVWQLNSENAMGQPTSVRTGNMARAYGYDAYGLPTSRNAGLIQAFGYRFEPRTGNLMSRTDIKRRLTETFGYDNLNRLVNVNGQTVAYADNGNLLSMPGVGTLEYADSERPYAVSGLTRIVASKSTADQTVKYNSFHSPDLIEADGFRATFTYDASGNRVCMSTPKMVKYYLDEYEVSEDGRLQIMYLGGDAYTAPMAYMRNPKILIPSWELVNICRDHLGSVTRIADVDGKLMREYSYDAWGNLRNPDSHKVYDDPMDVDLYLGRGYTGHEHLPHFGLINMNARLYDPETGRFLSPDPYVQMPDCPQNFNRYSYCMNNPLRYVDRDGKSIVGLGVVLLSAYLGASAVNGTFNPLKWDYGNIKTYAGMVIGGASAYAGPVVGKWTTTAFAASGAASNIVGGVVGGLVSGIMDGAEMSLLTGQHFSIWGSALTGALGGVSSGVKSLMGDFKGVVGSSLKNGLLELKHSALKGLAAGLSYGAVMTTMTGKYKYLWQGALNGMAFNTALSGLKIATLGTTICYDNALYKEVPDYNITYRRGSILMLGKGITLGNEISVKITDNVEENLSNILHEIKHYEQRIQMGTFNFYKQLFGEYFKAVFSDGGFSGQYFSPGTLEYAASLYSFLRLGYHYIDGIKYTKFLNYGN